MRTTKIFSAAVAAVAIAAAAITFYRTRPMAELVEAADRVGYRIIEGRLTGGFTHRRLAPVTRGASRQQLVVAGLTAFTPARSAEPHERGIARLLLGDWDSAIATFESALYEETQRDGRAALAASSNAELLSDLSAAYLARGRGANRPRDLVVALDAAERAWRLRRTPEIAWNRAVTREALHLREAARQAWDDYRVLDASSAWRGEADDRVRTLSTPTTKQMWEKDQQRLFEAVDRGDQREVARIVRAYPWHTRMVAEQQVLLEWAAKHRGSAAGEKSLAFCRAVGGALYRRGELLLHDTVAQIDSVSGSKRAAIIRALATYSRAADALDEWRPAEAGPLFREAAVALQAAGSPFAQAALMYSMQADRMERHDQVLANSDRWLATDVLNEERYRANAAQVRWIRGLCYLTAGRPQAAISEYTQALEASVALGETDNATALRLMFAEAYDYVGDADGAWQQRQATLAQLAVSGSKQTHLLESMTNAGVAALRDELPAAARVFLSSELAESTDPALFDARFSTLLWRSAASRAMGDHPSALDDLRAARALVPRIPDPAVRKRAAITPEVVRDRLAQTRDARARQAILDQAIRSARELGFGFGLAQIYLDQGLEHARAGRLDAARASLFHAADELDLQRGGISDEERRSTFVDSRQPIYAALMELLVRRGEYGRAFEMLERSRARTLLDQITGRSFVVREPLSLPQIRAALDDETLLVEYGRVADRLAVWLVSKSSVRFVVLPATLDDVNRAAEWFHRSIRERHRFSEHQAATLYATLVRPWDRYLRGFERLVVVPNEQLTGVPFAALLDQTDGSFLVESHVVTIAPSASIFAACVMRDRAIVRGGDSVLVMAPATSTVSAGDREMLGATSAEVADVGATYAHADVVSGPAATREVFLMRAPRAEVIHFAGHTGVAGLRVPHLRFASDGGSPDIVHAEDIRAMRLEATRTVVLATCSSASERGDSSAQGASSLARAFLAAGAPSVIAAYWEIEDKPAAQLSRRLHAHLAAGHDAAAALRLAQLEMLAPRGGTGGKRLGTWAAFAAIGGTFREERRP